MSDISAGVLVVGEALMDIVTDSSRSIAYPGGSPLNVAVGLARLGVGTTFLSELGEDQHGRNIHHYLSAAGVQTLIEPVERTASAAASIQADGSAQYSFDIAWRLDNPSVVPETALIHTGSIGSWLEPGSDVVADLVGGRRETTVASFDPNIRPALIEDRSTVIARVEELSRHCDLVKLSDEDAEWLYPGLSDEGVADHFLEQGATLFALTRGVRGSLVCSSKARVDLPGRSVRVADTIGAGDAYMSGLLFALVSSPYLEDVRERTALDETALRVLADIATMSATLTVARSGANPPSIDELESALTHAG
jgi:fructokinase